MKAKIRLTAQRLLNLYRQEHVIVGGWATINPVFVADASDEVIAELREMPTGKTLVQHIENLRSGKTKMDTIEPELLPYGGMMGQSAETIALTAAQWHELESGLSGFTPNQIGLDAFQSLPVVRQFGDEWPTAIRAAIATRPKLAEQWETVWKTYNAYRLWGVANEVVANPLTERVRAQIQADIPEFETYLPMFGDAGNELLGKLRTMISSLN